MIRAYVLVQAEMGRSGSIAGTLRSMAEVITADEVTGPYEVVAVVETQDVHTLGALLIRGIQQIPGIARTVTCTVHGR